MTIVPILTTIYQVNNAILSGIGNTFTLPHSHIPGTLDIRAEGQFLIENVDYTVSGTTVTTVGDFRAGAIVAFYYYLTL